MFAECDLSIENDYHNSVQGEYINTQPAEKNLYILISIIAIYWTFSNINLLMALKKLMLPANIVVVCQ